MKRKSLIAEREKEHEGRCFSVDRRPENFSLLTFHFVIFWHDRGGIILDAVNISTVCRKEAFGEMFRGQSYTTRSAFVALRVYPAKSGFPVKMLAREFRVIDTAIEIDLFVAALSATTADGLPFFGIRWACFDHVYKLTDRKNPVNGNNLWFF